MNPLAHSAIGRAGAVIACAAATGLLLAACSASPGSSTSTAASSGPKPGSGGAAGTPSAGPSQSSGLANNSGTGSGSVVSSTSEPFPVAVGNNWIYHATEATPGPSNTVTNKVLSIAPLSGGHQVTMSNTDSITGTTTDSTYIFHPDGSITYPFSQLGTEATIVKGTLQWPPASVINAGQSASSTIEIGLRQGSATNHLTAHITVKGAGTATVTVPAGTYSTTIVQMTENFTVLGHTETIIVRTWMASGVGPVQSTSTIVVLGHSQLVSKLKLGSFKQG